MNCNRFLGLDMVEVFRQKMLILDLASAVRKEGHDQLADELEAALAVFDAVQDKAEEKFLFEGPIPDEKIGLFPERYYNNVLEGILKDEQKARNAANSVGAAGTQKKTMYHAKRKPTVSALVKQGNYYDACLQYQRINNCTFAEACNAIAEKYLKKTGKKAGNEGE